MSMTAPTATPELDSGLEVLRFARSRRADALAAEADVILAAVTWAEQHPVESIDLAATWPAGGGGETGIPLAGPGAPWVAEFCIPEFALAIGDSTDAGRAKIADGLELKYRLPRTWARVVAGDLPVWRARRVAQTTQPLTREAAAYVDAQVAPFAHRLGPAALDRLVEEAVGRFMPAEAEAAADAAAERRFFDIHHDHVAFAGTSRIEGELDLADALDLESALQREAAALRAAGCEESLDVRRSMAAGVIARRQLALDLRGDQGADGQPEVKPGPKTRQVILYVHLSEAALTGDSRLARVENHRHVLTVEQIKTWCAAPDAAVIVKPVIDLGEHLATDAYEVPARLREQMEVRDRSCVFPWCTRPARKCDGDHVIAYERGGTTCSCNIAPLCRRHHRLKTHAPWSYTVLEPGAFLWSSPHGYQFLVDTDGTLDVTRDRDTCNRAHPPDE